MEHMLAEDLFPNYLSVEEMTRHWIFFVSLHTIFTPSHEKALNSILSHKQRYCYCTFSNFGLEKRSFNMFSCFQVAN